VVQGRGDGAVALERARLTGVEDTVVLHFSHLEMLSGAGEPETAELWRAILERLGRRP
jgi:hypothetical protein